MSDTINKMLRTGMGEVSIEKLNVPDLKLETVEVT